MRCAMVISIISTTSTFATLAFTFNLVFRPQGLRIESSTVWPEELFASSSLKDLWWRANSAIISTPATTANVLDSLIHEKLVIKNQDTSKSHKKKKTLATYTLIGDEESVVRAYFDPRKGLYALFPVLTAAFSNPDNAAEHISAEGGYPVASYSRGVFTVRGLPNHSRRATSCNDGTTQSGSSPSTPLCSRSRVARDRLFEHSRRTVSVRGNSQTPEARRPSPSETISPTASNFSYRSKRLAELSFEHRPAQRRKTGLMSPMLVGADFLEISQ
ncbi:unnamed protein product [Diplocarpon coronariae]